MSLAILATGLGRAVTLFASCGKLAAPCLTRAPKPSCQALVPIVKMFSMRRDCLLRSAFQRLSEDRRYAKRNHFRHYYLLHACESLRKAANSPTFVQNYSVLDSHNRSLSKNAPHQGNSSPT